MDPLQLRPCPSVPHGSAPNFLMEMTSSDPLPVQGVRHSMAESDCHVLCISSSLVGRPVPTTPGKKKDLGQWFRPS